jgi:transposase InsO family protein
LEQEIHKG